MKQGMIKFLWFWVLFFSNPAYAAEEAIFAGGCFWCMEKDFEQLDGVKEVISGYAGGDVRNPTYEQVTAGGTGHKEVVKVVYDPERISYADLLRVFWVNIDPFDAAGQFCDKGASYRAAIFYAMPEQKDLAEQSKIIVEKEILKRAVVTPVEPVSAFYPAEGYHQDYYKTNALKYKFYRWNCGRDARLAEVWEKQDITPLKRLD